MANDPVVDAAIAKIPSVTKMESELSGQGVSLTVDTSVVPLYELAARAGAFTEQDVFSAAADAATSGSDESRPPDIERT
jgi:hypothetical protein